MTFFEGVLLFIVGIFAGAINTVAGGGSLITVPLLIFMSIPSPIANATNRLAIFLQNIFAVQGFRSKGVSVFPYSNWVALSSIAGAVIGSFMAVEISAQLFNRLLALVMVIVMVLIMAKISKKNESKLENFSQKRTILSVMLFFIVGLYGGFIQAGIGFLVIAILTQVHNMSLQKTNFVKVYSALCYTSVSILIFIYYDRILWDYGITLACGNAIGGWVSSRWSVGKDEKWIKIILVIAMGVMAIKLWFF